MFLKNQKYTEIRDVTGIGSVQNLKIGQRWADPEGSAHQATMLRDDVIR